MDNPNPPSSLPELLQPEQSQKAYKRRRRRKSRFRWVRRARRRLKKFNWRIVLIVVLGTVAVIVMSGLVLTMDARNQLDDSWASLDRVWSHLNNTPGTELTLTDFNRLQVATRDLSDSLSNARRQTSFLRPLSFLSADLETSLDALDAGQELALAADKMLTGLEPTLNFLTEGEEDAAVATQISSGERVVELLRLGRSQFLSAQTHLDKAQREIDALDLGDVSADLLVTVDGLAKYHEQLADINQTLLESDELLTSALGLTDTQTYLVLSHNSDELRPSGGYTSTYGWMTVRNGRIVNYDYSPTTVTSPNPPPASMADQVAVPDWWLQYQQPIYAAWDGSWYADFPSTAAMAAWYYNAGDNPHAPVDGVIGIDLVAVEFIMEALGEVTLPDYGDTITAETFRDAVYQVRAERETGDAHKRYVAALYYQILTEWQALDQDQSVELRGALLRALQEKHIMIYFTDPAMNDALDILGWLGAQEPGTEDDYLMVADANLGNKSNRSVVRQLTYDVEIQPDGTLACRTAISYDFPARLAEEDPAAQPTHHQGSIDYNNLMQVFVPANSTLTDFTNLIREPAIVQTETHTIFTETVLVRYNQSERFVFSYTTPVLVEAFGPYRRYTLHVEKQPGMISELVNVQVTLPAGARTVHVTPKADASYQLEQPVLEFRINLETDQTIEIIYTQ